MSNYTHTVPETLTALLLIILTKKSIITSSIINTSVYDADSQTCILHDIIIIKWRIATGIFKF